MEQMFVSARTTAAEPGEMLTALVIDLPEAGGLPSSGAFYKLTRRAAMDLALLNVSVQLWLNQDKTVIEQARVAAGVVAPTPVRLPECEKVLTGQAPGAKVFQTASQAAGGDCSPRDSNRCSAWYREELLRVLIERTAAVAYSRLGGEAGGLSS
jgi:CO/xanthine dehydrogenase FAD-binding subunit